ncbi:MAG: Hsp20/alpha crystallin family protein [Chloroflexota bacterium]|nr:MAG: Hsp20/alpha crystallin family protein [Chloroflexota bacterium]
MTDHDPYSSTGTILFNDDMDPVFEDSLARSLSNWPQPAEVDHVIPLDMYDHGDHLEINVSTPGLKPEDVSITVTGYQWKVAGVFSPEQEPEHGIVYINERSLGRFERSVTLPASADLARMESKMEDGVLHVRIPKIPKGERGWRLSRRKRSG